MGITCGIGIGGNDANIVLLEGDKSGYSIIKSEFKKIKLDDDGDQSQIKSFHEAIENFMGHYKVDKLCVRRPSINGKFKASPTAIKIEAILQLSSIPVELFHATTISSILKKNIIPDEKYDTIHKYQHAAFDVAFCGLNN